MGLARVEYKLETGGLRRRCGHEGNGVGARVGKNLAHLLLRGKHNLFAGAAHAGGERWSLSWRAARGRLSALICVWLSAANTQNVCGTESEKGEHTGENKRKQRCDMTAMTPEAV